MNDSRLASPMQDESGPSDGLRMLRRIAEALDRPVSDFYRRDEKCAGLGAPTAEECDRLLVAFSRVVDPRVRAQILTLIRGLAGH